MELNNIKGRLSIMEVVSDLAQGKLYRVGGSAWRFDPCPLCGHNGCFTLGEKGRNGFNCYSCGKYGDVFDFVQEMRGVDLAGAVEFLRDRYGLIEEEKGKVRPGQFADNGAANGGKVSAAKAPITEGTNPERPAISEAEAENLCDLRRRAALFYHDCLMNDMKALEYQISIRKHDRGTLEKELVGVAARSLVSHCAEVGIDPLDMERIGLLRRSKDEKLRDYIMTGMTVFPHSHEGKVIFFTIKDPDKGRQYQLPKRFADPAWIAYGQDALQAPEFWLVEGEHDRLSLFDAGEVAVATIGQFCRPELTRWFSDPANCEGKIIYLAFDKDEAGDKYHHYYSSLIIRGGGRVMKVQF